MLGRIAVPGKLAKIPTAGNNVCIVLATPGNEIGDQLRLMLAVTIDGDQDVISAADGKLERRTECRSIASIAGVPDQVNIISAGQQLGSAVSKIR